MLNERWKLAARRGAPNVCLWVKAPALGRTCREACHRAALRNSGHLIVC